MWLIVALGTIALASVTTRLPEIAATTPPSLRQRVAVMTDPRVAATIAVSLVTSAASIGLYTFVATLLQAMSGITDALPYLWAWSLGGVVGIYFCSVLIDATGRPEWVMSAVHILMFAVFVTLESALPHPALALVLFGVWGAAAWSSQGPQQYRLLSLHGDKASVVVALQSSAHYLGSAAGAALCGSALIDGVRVNHLPLIAAGLILVALSGQIGIAARATSELHRATRNVVPIKRDAS